MATKIGVFPASGGLGTSILNHLSKQVPASQLVPIARNPEKLATFEREGATIRQADYDQPSTLETAFDGIDVLMLISYASFEIDHRVKVRKIYTNLKQSDNLIKEIVPPHRYRCSLKKRRQAYLLLFPRIWQRNKRQVCRPCYGSPHSNREISLLAERQIAVHLHS